MRSPSSHTSKAAYHYAKTVVGGKDVDCIKRTQTDVGCVIYLKDAD